MIERDLPEFQKAVKLYEQFKLENLSEIHFSPQNEQQQLQELKPQVEEKASKIEANIVSPQDIPRLADLD